MKMRLIFKQYQRKMAFARTWLANYGLGLDCMEFPSRMGGLNLMTYMNLSLAWSWLGHLLGVARRTMASLR